MNGDMIDAGSLSNYNQSQDILGYIDMKNTGPLTYGRIKDLIKYDFGLPPHIIVVPGKLHEVEEKCLEMLR